MTFLTQTPVPSPKRNPSLDVHMQGGKRRRLSIPTGKARQQRRELASRLRAGAHTTEGEGSLTRKGDKKHPC